MSIYWKEELATGIDYIDDQHKEIFARFETFSSACTDGTGSAELKELVDFLSDYTGHHFHDEELVMTGAKYPELPAQKAAHAEFLADFTRLKELVDGQEPGRETVLAEKRVMIQWLVNHISHMDRAFAEYYTGKRPSG